MSLIKFEQPSWLNGVSAKGIQKNMMGNLPSDIDTTEAGWVWDLTYPTALEKAEILQYHLIRTLKIMHPMWATGRWLDYHANENGLERRVANKAYGMVTVSGVAGKTIPAGFVFSVPASGDAAAIDFETLTEVVIPGTGKIDITIQAVVAGKGGNVTNDTITIMREPIKGITSITNVAAVTGGAAEESDDSLRQRIDDLLAGKGDSFVGNNADYVRWAKEVSGVGNAHTIPEWSGPNTVKLVVIDADGLPANEQILQNVYTHIYGTTPKDLARLAPIGAILTVAAPTPIIINYVCKIKLDEGMTKEAAVISYKTKLSSYYSADASSDGTVKYVMAAAILAEIDGVNDFVDFTMNGSANNISFDEDEYPVTGMVEVEVYV